jgi:hypothetical protein
MSEQSNLEAHVIGEQMASQYGMTLNHRSGSGHYAYFSDAEKGIGMNVFVTPYQVKYQFTTIVGLMCEVKSPEFSIPNKTADKWYQNILDIKIAYEDKHE